VKDVLNDAADGTMFVKCRNNDAYRFIHSKPTPTAGRVPKI